MKRYIRIFLLYFQHVLNFRSRIIVWLLIPIINSLVMIGYWKGAFSSGQIIDSHWNFASVATYYLFIVALSSFLMSHIEEDIAVLDIQRGGLLKYLLKPFSFYFLKFYEELPWRLIQGTFGICIFAFIWILFKGNLVVVTSMGSFILATMILILGFLISQTFKVIVGLSAFWLTDFRGFQQLVEVSILVFGGYVMPLHLFPDILGQFALATPFAYMVYFPILAFQGKLAGFEFFKVIITQLIWLCLLLVVYTYMFKKGIKKFTGVGQ